MKKKIALVLGATGLTGNLLLQKLLADDNYSTIKVFTRKTCGIKHPKIQEFIGDLLQLEQFKKMFTGDEIFCCIGTTKSQTPQAIEYRKIDVGIPVAAAQLAKANHIPFLAVISAMGAKIDSILTYNRLKGEMEKAILNENLPYTYIFRPSLITGHRKEKRFLEDWGNIFLACLRPFMLGYFRQYRPISAETIATALVKTAHTRPKLSVIPSDKIETIALST